MASSEFYKLVDFITKNPPPPGVDHATARAGMEAAAARNALPPSLRVETAKGAPVPAEWLIPEAAGENVVVYFHGGGFALGSIGSHRHVAAWLAESAGAKAIIFDYRLAPEYPFPAALDDCAALYRWLIENWTSPSRIAFAGDSAGANLAIVTALELVADARPAAIAALSPTVNLQSYFATDAAANTDPSIDSGMIADTFRAYLGDTPALSPRVSPIFGALEHLPPTLVQVAEREMFAPAARRFVELALEAGTRVELDEWPEMLHAWHWFAPRLPEAREALMRAGRFLSNSFQPAA